MKVIVATVLVFFMMGVSVEASHQMDPVQLEKKADAEEIAKEEKAATEALARAKKRITRAKVEVKDAEKALATLRNEISTGKFTMGEYSNSVIDGNAVTYYYPN